MLLQFYCTTDHLQMKMEKTIKAKNISSKCYIHRHANIYDMTGWPVLQIYLQIENDFKE